MSDLWSVAEEPDRSATPPHIARSTAASGQGRALVRNLLIDDNPVILVVLKAHLSKLGDCDVAKTGREGLEAFTRSLEEQRPYDLICLDLQMPGLGGEELLTQIRQLEAERKTVRPAKVLIVTGTNDADTVRAVVGRGADGYLLKPIDRNLLKEQLVNLELIQNAP